MSSSTAFSNQSCEDIQNYLHSSNENSQYIFFFSSSVFIVDFTAIYNEMFYHTILTLQANNNKNGGHNMPFTALLCLRTKNKIEWVQGEFFFCNSTGMKQMKRILSTYKVSGN